MHMRKGWSVQQQPTQPSCVSLLYLLKPAGLKMAHIVIYHMLDGMGLKAMAWGLMAWWERG